MNVLIPVQYPLTETNERAIQRGIDIVTGHNNSELVVFYMNEIQKSHRIGRKELRDAVESEFEDLEANYVVRDGILIEESIIEEAIRLGIHSIILSKHRRDRWQRLLEEVFGANQNPEQFIRNHAGIDVEVID